jgi:hypothetical protein
MKGKEKVAWIWYESVTEGEGEQMQTRQEKRKHTDKHTVFKVKKVTLIHHPEGLAPGSYEFPFSIPTINSLPGTFFYKA